MIRAIQCRPCRRLGCEQATCYETAARFTDGLPGNHIDVAAGANVTTVECDVFTRIERQYSGNAFNVRVDQNVAGCTRRCQIDRPTAARSDAGTDGFRSA